MGLAIDHAKVENLIRGKTFIHRTPSASVAEEVQAGRFLASPDVLRVCKSHALVICVPTLLNRNREPCSSFIIATGKAIAPHLQKGMLVALESRTYPGTTALNTVWFLCRVFGRPKPNLWVYPVISRIIRSWFVWGLTTTAFDPAQHP